MISRNIKWICKIVASIRRHVEMVHKAGSIISIPIRVYQTVTLINRPVERIYKAVTMINRAV